MTWPPVFDGVGALVVNCALDPDALVDRIPGLTWIAFKVGGSDVASDVETQHCYDRWRARGMKVGAWVYCDGPPAQDVTTLESAVRFGPIAFGIFDVESAYKTDEAGPAVATWPAELTTLYKTVACAVTSYGAIPGLGNYPSTIDFEPFAAAGWPILAQLYDGYDPAKVPGAELTYSRANNRKYPGPYPLPGIHKLIRSLLLSPGQAVYRPEGL